MELLIPVKQFKKTRGRCTLPGTVVLSATREADRLPLAQLAVDLKQNDRKVKTAAGLTTATVILGRNRALSHPEAYRMTITPGGIRIVAATDAGAYYGVQTLRDLLHIHDAALPCCVIDDWPTFARRGVYHDTARGKIPKLSTIKRFIELLAHWKVNELQFLVENAFTFKKHPDIGKGWSPFTPDDILKIREHCRRHHVTFVPSLQTFGHMEKILMLPRYRALGELPDGNTLCPTDPRSIRLVEDLIDEYAPLFDAEDFNPCLDEPKELARGRSKAAAKRKGVGKLYLDFVLKVHKICLKHNKRMNMWGDVVLMHPEIIPYIPKDIVMLNWQYNNANPVRKIERTGEFAKADLALVCCPGTNAWRSHGSRLRVALENVSYFSRVALQHGAEGVLNTNWGDEGHRNTLAVSLCSLAHGAAHAWHTEDVQDKRHVRNFTLHTYGDRGGELAREIELLGDGRSNWWAYPAMVESLIERKAWARPPWYPAVKMLERENLPFLRLGRPAPAAAQRHIDELKRCRFAAPTKRLDPFLLTCLEEYRLAADMDRLAWVKLNLARVLRKGGKVDRRRLKTHADEMEVMIKRFALLWRRRNRPSRLSDNLYMMRCALKEARTLANRT